MGMSSFLSGKILFVTLLFYFIEKKNVESHHLLLETYEYTFLQNFVNIVPLKRYFLGSIFYPNTEYCVSYTYFLKKKWSLRITPYNSQKSTHKHGLEINTYLIIFRQMLATNVQYAGAPKKNWS